MFTRKVKKKNVSKPKLRLNHKLIQKRLMMENDLLFIRQGSFVEELVGWQDYNDLATQTTPIDLTVADEWYPLTNDGLGPFTQTKYRVLGKPDIWRPATNQFYLGDLFMGGMQFLRTSFWVKAPSANTEVLVRMRMAIGSGSEYNIPVFGRQIKKSNTFYNFSPLTMFTIDNPETRDYPAEIQISTDTSNAEAKVDGWKIITIDRF
jgi:hypothetical protein